MMQRGRVGNPPWSSRPKLAILPARTARSPNQVGSTFESAARLTSSAARHARVREARQFHDDRLWCYSKIGVCPRRAVCIIHMV